MKTEIIKSLVEKKVENDNRIDLHAYANGLCDMYDHIAIQTGKIPNGQPWNLCIDDAVTDIEYGIGYVRSLQPTLICEFKDSKDANIRFSYGLKTTFYESQIQRLFKGHYEIKMLALELKPPMKFKVGDKIIFQFDTDVRSGIIEIVNSDEQFYGIKVGSLYYSKIKEEKIRLFTELFKP